MLRTRFDRTEETSMDKATKLAGKSPVAQGILNKVILYVSPMENIYMGMIDQMGLYGKRIELLYKACGSNIGSFSDTVSTLSERSVSQDRIIAMKTQEEFDTLVKEYQ